MSGEGYTPSTTEIWEAALYGASRAAEDSGEVLNEAEFRCMFERWLALERIGLSS